MTEEFKAHCQRNELLRNNENRSDIQNLIALQNSAFETQIFRLEDKNYVSKLWKCSFGVRLGNVVSL